MERTVTYFETLGPENTDVTFRLARERAHELGIHKIVIASTTGATARKAMDCFRDDGVQLVIIPHQWDFHREVNPFPRTLPPRCGRQDTWSTSAPCSFTRASSSGRPYPS